MKKNLPTLVLLTCFILLWQVLATKMDAAYILPSPSQILMKIWVLKKPLFTVHLPATMYVTSIGLVISIVLGFFFAITMDASKFVEKAIYPLIIGSQTIPVTALAPLFILWFGYGSWSKIVVVVLMTFFPITVTVFDGFKMSKREIEELLITYGANSFDVFLKLKLPTALPNFFSAIKMAIPISIIGAAIGEWLGAQSGLGYFSKRMVTQLDGAGVFAPIVILSLIAIVLVSIINVLEKILITWRKEV